MNLRFPRTLCIVFFASSAMFLASGAEAQDTSDTARGKEVYAGTCVACHGPTGKGTIPGTPDFNKANGVLSQDDDVLKDHIINGFRGRRSAMPMPAKGGNASLTDSDIDDVLVYLHETFDHE
jgi:mono/diheme cytochrome c family protein